MFQFVYELPPPLVYNQDTYLQGLKIDLYIASFFKLLWRFSDSFAYMQLQWLVHE